MNKSILENNIPTFKSEMKRIRASSREEDTQGFSSGIFISKHLIYICLILVVLLGVFLRFYQLGENPPSLDWDEASLGYNAYSILKTGADEYGNYFPFSIRSFDDYKPPLYVYLAIPGISVFGLNEFSTRLPSAFFGSVTILIVFFLVLEFLRSDSEKINLTTRYVISLLSSLLLSISPWHLQFSRSAFESNLGLFFFTSGVLFLLVSLRKKIIVILSLMLLSLSIYSYHSYRLIVPLFLIGFCLIYFRRVLENKNSYIVGVAIMFVMLIPIISGFLFNNSASSRFSSVTILKPEGTLDKSINLLQYDKDKGDLIGQLFHNRRVVYFLTIAKGYFDHWSFDFLFLNGDGVERHHALNVGMLYLMEFPFVLIGVYQIIRQKLKAGFIIFLWFLLAPAAAALTSGTPHPVRALIFLPIFQVFTSFGLFYAIEFMKRWNRKYLVPAIFVAALLFLANISYYFHQYYIHSPIEYSKSWQYGYKEVMQQVRRIEGKYDKILISYQYDQPYIYYLFYNKIDPLWYQKNWDYLGNAEIERSRRVIGKYEFRHINWGIDQKLTRTLIVASSSEVPDDVNTIKQIYFLDGQLAFKFIEI